MSSSEPEEVVAKFIRQHEDTLLVVDDFPRTTQNTHSYQPQVIKHPNRGRVSCHQAESVGRIRFSYTEFTDWLQRENLPRGMVKKIVSKLDGTSNRKMRLGIGTEYTLPRQRIIEVGLPNALPDAPEETIDE